MTVCCFWCGICNCGLVFSICNVSCSASFVYDGWFGRQNFLFLLFWHFLYHTYFLYDGSFFFFNASPLKSCFASVGMLSFSSFALSNSLFVILWKDCKFIAVFIGPHNLTIYKMCFYTFWGNNCRRSLF